METASILPPFEDVISVPYLPDAESCQPMTYAMTWLRPCHGAELSDFFDEGASATARSCELTFTDLALRYENTYFAVTTEEVAYEESPVALPSPLVQAAQVHCNCNRAAPKAMAARTASVDLLVLYSRSRDFEDGHVEPAGVLPPQPRFGTGQAAGDERAAPPADAVAVAIRRVLFSLLRADPSLACSYWSSTMIAAARLRPSEDPLIGPLCELSTNTDARTEVDTAMRDSTKGSATERREYVCLVKQAGAEDFWYDAGDMRWLGRTSQQRNRRARADAFAAAHCPVVAPLETEEDLTACSAFTAGEWWQEKARASPSPRAARDTLFTLRLLARYRELRAAGVALRGIVVRVADTMSDEDSGAGAGGRKFKVAAFQVAELVDGGRTLVVHAEKAARGLYGSYQYVAREAARRLGSHDYVKDDECERVTMPTRINRQNAPDRGLRQVKKALGPVELVHKWSVKLSLNANLGEDHVVGSR